MLKNTFELREGKLWQVITITKGDEKEWHVMGTLLKAGYTPMAIKNGFQLEKKLKEEK